MIYYKFAIYATYYVSVILSYMILVTMVGYFRALIAKWMGDDTAEHQGFLTLNPAVHADLFGLILLIFLGMVGDAKSLLIRHNIHGRFRWLKLSLAMLSGVFAYLFFAVVGLVALAFAISPAEAFGHIGSSASASASVISILDLFITMCVFLAAIELVINIVLLGHVVCLGTI